MSVELPAKLCPGNAYDLPFLAHRRFREGRHRLETSCFCVGLRLCSRIAGCRYVSCRVRYVSRNPVIQAFHNRPAKEQNAYRYWTFGVRIKHVNKKIKNKKNDNLFIFLSFFHVFVHFSLYSKCLSFVFHPSQIAFNLSRAQQTLLVSQSPKRAV